MDLVEDEGGEYVGAVGIGVVAHGDEALPKILVISRDVHFRDSRGELPFFNECSVNAIGEISGRRVGVATDETADQDSSADISDELIEALVSRRKNQVGATSGCRLHGEL